MRRDASVIAPVFASVSQQADLDRTQGDAALDWILWLATI
jgi:hypothetical protein